MTKESANRDEAQKTFIIYNKKEEEFKDNFKQGQQIPINYLNYDLKEDRLNPKAKPELDRLIDLLNKNKSVNIEVAGYADDGGNTRVEKMIAMRRAKEVEKYLIMHGLPENRITVKSYGNTRPLVPGSSEKAKAKNRRVEIIVR
jgi:outer membrane protein OmpA-like peptidoglycan-associated protein